MLPPVVYQQQQHQQNNEFNCGTNSQICSMMMTTDCLKSAAVQNMSPPFLEFSTHSAVAQLNSGIKSSQLKETHSALVKILESAPIPSKTSTSSTVQQPQPQPEQQPQQQQPPPPSTFTKSTTILVHHSANQPSTYHRKRNKHLNAISAHCDMDKSSDEEVGCSSNSSASSNASEAEIICPWKKTRIAREWHQSQKMDEDAMIDRPTITTIPTINLNM